jgi:hypothetical protein
MAFTDPILSGNELVRGSITSENYVAGQDGWGIHKDGSAEFQDITVRNTINVNGQILYNGKDLWAAADAHSLGVIAWIQGKPNVSTTTETSIFFTEADVRAGRIYEALLTNVTCAPESVQPVEFLIRYEWGTAKFPDNSSPVLGSSYQISGIRGEQIRIFFGTPANQRIRLRASIWAVAGGTAVSWCPQGDGTLAIIDHGLQPPYVGSVVTSPPKTVKEFSATLNNSKTYVGNGTGWTSADPLYMYQGNWADGYGDRESWISFSSGSLSLFSDLAGVVYDDYLLCELYVYALGWQSGSGKLPIGWHSTTTLTTNRPGGGQPNKQQTTYTGTGGVWTDLMAGGSGAGGIMDSFKTGSFKGFMFGRAGSGTQYCSGVEAYSASGGHQILFHVKYRK